jgi:hypothetical protein
MGMWDNIEKVDVFQKSAYFAPGVFLASVLCCRARDGHKGEAFIVEFKIHESSNKENPAETEASWVRKFGNKEQSEMSQRAIIAFVTAALGYEVTEDNVTKVKGSFRKLIERITGEENMLAGKMVRIEATAIKTKAGGDFTLLKFSPVAA